MGLSDYQTALRMRDMIRKLVKSEVELSRPVAQYATVKSIDRINRKCIVWFTGDSTNISVSMGAMQPQNAGQVVRIAGIPGDRYIDDIMGPVYMRATMIQNVQQIGASADLNYLPEGLWNQKSTLDAASGTNYPSPVAGLLTAFFTCDWPDMLHQTYESYDNTGIWKRTRFLGAWGAWRRIDATTPSVSALPLSNSWVDYTTGWETANYELNAGRVYVGGLVKNGVVTSGTTIGTLPQGFRPGGNKTFTCVTGASPYVARVDVNPSGLITANLNVSNGYLSLDTINFRQVN